MFVIPGGVTTEWVVLLECKPGIHFSAELWIPHKGTIHLVVSPASAGMMLENAEYSGCFVSQKKLISAIMPKKRMFSRAF